MAKLVGSYSLFNDYVNCPHKAFRKYVARDIPFKKTVATEWGNTVHDGMDKRISVGRPLEGNTARFEKWAAAFDGKPVETEVKIGVREDGGICGFYDDDCYVHCKADLLYTPGDYTIRQFDWKTGKVREDPWELRINGALAQARNPEVRTVLSWYVWLGEGPNGRLGQQHDCSDVEKTWAEIDSLMHTIRNYAAIGHWPKKENPLCGWCEVLDCQFNKNKG